MATFEIPGTQLVLQLSVTFQFPLSPALQDPWHPEVEKTKLSWVGEIIGEYSIVAFLKAFVPIVNSFTIELPWIKVTVPVGVTNPLFVMLRMLPELLANVTAPEAVILP